MLDVARPPSAARRLVSPWIPRRGLAIAITLASVFSAGAARTREAPVRNAARDGADRVASSLGVSACARGVLSRHGLLRAALVNPGGAALRLEAALASRPEGEPGVTLALAELWYRAALRQPHHDPASAAPPLRAAAAAAALALTEPDGECCDRAIEVHNDAVARLVRISQDERVAGGRDWPGALTGLGVVAAGGDSFVDPGRFAAVVVADDVRAGGPGHRHPLRRPGPPDRDGRAVLPASAPDRGDRAGRARRRAGRRGLQAVVARAGLPRPVPRRFDLGRRACPAAGGRPHDPSGVAGVAGPAPGPGDPRRDRHGVRAGDRAGPVHAPALRA